MRLAHSQYKLKFTADPDRLLTAESERYSFCLGLADLFVIFSSSLLWWPDVFIAATETTWFRLGSQSCVDDAHLGAD
jgi:hypothetical protein